MVLALGRLGTDAFDESIPREIIDHRIAQQEQKRRELVEMLVWERDKIMAEGPGQDLSDLNLGSDDSSSAVLNVSAVPERCRGAGALSERAGWVAGAKEGGEAEGEAEG